MADIDHYLGHFRSLAQSYAHLPALEFDRMVSDQIEGLRAHMVGQGFSPAEVSRELAAARAAADSARLPAAQAPAAAPAMASAPATASVPSPASGAARLSAARG